MDVLTADEARRIALTAQGFDRKRPARVTAAQIERTIRALGLVQLDFVNVVVPAHYLVIHARLGPYPRARLDDVIYRSGAFTEQWAHEASVVPHETWPLLRYRMEARRHWVFRFEQQLLSGHPRYVDEVLEQVRARGPLGADDLAEPAGVARRIRDSWWGTVPRSALEALFARGKLAVVERLPSMARTFDLVERHVPHHAHVVAPHDAHRTLLTQAAAAHGVATAANLADYWRMSARDARPRLAELVEDGTLRAVRVDGWREPALLHRGARARAVDARALLAPFDPLIWYRPRALRVFGFDYRFEIFVPQAKRRWGTYVLPFLLGDRLVARVDVKALRDARTLHVPAAYLEPGARVAEVAPALRAELDALATWLDLDAVTIGRRGDRALLRGLRSN